VKKGKRRTKNEGKGGKREKEEEQEL